MRMKIVVLDGYASNPGDLSWGPFEQMGELTPEEERAYLKARTHYLEEMLIAQKKIRAELEEFFT